MAFNIMWHRFTQKARQVVVNAMNEQLAMNSGYVGTEHLLLSVLRKDDGIATQVLEQKGIDIRKCQEELKRLNKTEATPNPADPKLTSKSKKTLEIAADEARTMRLSNIGTEHILLGLLRESEGTAAKVLKVFGLHLEAVRKQIAEYHGLPNDLTEVSVQRLKEILNDFFTPEAKTLILRALAESEKVSADKIGIEQLLIAVSYEGLSPRLLEMLHE